MQHVAWNDVADFLDKTWYFVDIICDFTVECGAEGSMIHTDYLLFDECQRIDKLTMDHANSSTQHRRVIANAISKAIDIAYIQVIKKWMHGRHRLVHVSMDKVPQQLISMCKHVFM
jgi:hypothetical protein